MGDVTVVIGNHQGADVLDDCLASLHAQTEPPVEVIVVDAGSTDASREIADGRGAHWLQQKNRGLGYLYNRGAEAATTDYVLLANNDVALDAGCLGFLRRALEDDQGLFAADPHQLDWSGERLVHGHVTLSRGALFGELLPGLHLDQMGSADTVVPTVMANGGCMMVRRSMSLQLDGFDETFFLDFEDLDICWRAWLRGWGSVYVPNATLRHRVGASTTARILPRRLASSHHNLMRFALKCLPLAEAATIIAVEVLRLGRSPRPIAAGAAALVPELPEILRLRKGLRPSARLLWWMLAGQPPQGRPKPRHQG